MALSQPRTVDDLLNYRLSRLLAASGAMITLLCEGRYGITRREWRVIALLAAHGAMSPSELAERAHMPRPRVSRLVTDLVERRLVRREPVPQDGRRARLELSESGRGLYDELFPQSVHFTGEVLAALTPAELRAFDAALEKLTANAERIAALRPVPEKADRQHGGGRRLRPR